MAVGIAPSLPLAITGDDGHYQLLKTVQQVAEQNLKMLFLTCPGERIMDINFGIGIRNYLFEPYVEKTLGEIRARIEAQVGRYLKYIKISKIRFDNNGSVTGQSSSPIVDNLLSITLEYEIHPLSVGAILTIPISA